MAAASKPIKSEVAQPVYDWCLGFQSDVTDTNVAQCMAEVASRTRKPADTELPKAAVDAFTNACGKKVSACKGKLTSAVLVKLGNGGSPAGAAPPATPAAGAVPPATGAGAPAAGAPAGAGAPAAGEVKTSGLYYGLALHYTYPGLQGLKQANPSSLMAGMVDESNQSFSALAGGAEVFIGGFVSDIIGVGGRIGWLTIGRNPLMVTGPSGLQPKIIGNLHFIPALVEGRLGLGGNTFWLNLEAGFLIGVGGLEMQTSSQLTPRGVWLGGVVARPSLGVCGFAAKIPLCAKLGVDLSTFGEVEDINRKGFDGTIDRITSSGAVMFFGAVEVILGGVH